MGSSCKKHDWLVNKIYEHPEIVSISSDDVISKTQEYALNYRGHLLTVPDLYFKTKLADRFIEVKSMDSEYLFKKGMSQLEKTVIWYESNIGMMRHLPKLVMPKHKNYDTWIDMLHDLKYYLPGDRYTAPRYF